MQHLAVPQFVYDSLKFPADISISLSFPILLWRIRKYGPDGVSVETQVAHLVMFVTRYLDIFVWRHLPLYNVILRCYLTLGSLAILIVLIAAQRETKRWNIGSFRYSLPLVLVAPVPVALKFHYLPTTLEVLWSYSIFLGAIAEIPQLVLSHKDGIDRWMVAYLVSIFCFRWFYMIRWILRSIYQDCYGLGLKLVDGIAMAGGAVQISIFAIFFFLMVAKSYRPANEETSHEGHEDEKLLKPSVPASGDVKTNV